MKTITSTEATDTNLPVGVYWCAETTSVIVQTYTNGAPSSWSMEFGWAPDPEPEAISAPLHDVSIERILAVALHASAAEKLIGEALE